MKFSELGLHPLLQAGIDQLGYDDCTPIQEKAIGPILGGKDVAGLAQTGTGKTAAFLVPLIERILRAQDLGTNPQSLDESLRLRGYGDWKPQNFILVLVPTRELAEQVQENLTKIASQAPIKGFAIYGGTSYEKQKEALKNGLQFVIATPGRLIDLYKEHLVDLKQVRAIVFDEADRMFDMGFKDDMKYILQRVPKNRQFLVFSATLNFDVLNTAYQFGSEPVELNVSPDQTKAENVRDEIYHVGQEEKPQHLLSLLRLKKPKQAIVFSNFKHNVERIARFLNENGQPAMAISSLMTQAQRTKVMQQFKEENDLNILVATDVAARGLDIKGVDVVINFDLPMDSESYVHRIGRTGRAGAEGEAYSLVSDKDVESLSRIEEFLGNKVKVGFLEDKDLVKDHRPMIEDRGGFSHRRGPRPGGGEGPRRFDGPKRFSRGPRPNNGAGDRRPEGPRPLRTGDQNSFVKKGDHPGKPSRPRHEKTHPRPAQNGSALHRERKVSPRHPRPNPRTPPLKIQQKSLGTKITSFFKRIFGS